MIFRPQHSGRRIRKLDLTQQVVSISGSGELEPLVEFFGKTSYVYRLGGPVGDTRGSAIVSGSYQTFLF